MKKNLEITINQAKELLVSMPSLSGVIYNSFPDLKPKPVVFDRWEDLEKVGGYYVKDDASVHTAATGSTYQTNKNVYKTQKQALSSLAYAQLTQLMAATGDCDVDWSDDMKNKYCIRRDVNNIGKCTFYSRFQFIAFNTTEVRDEFLQKHEGLIKQFFQL